MSLNFEEFEKNHRPDTVELVKKVEGKNVHLDEFVEAYKKLEGSRRSPSKAHAMLKFLQKVGYIKLIINNL